MASVWAEIIGRGVLAWMDKRPFSKEAKARRKARRKAKREGMEPEAVEVEVEVPMNQQVITQIALGIVRHIMTATGVGVYLSDDIVVQAVSAIVAVVGAIWMARRKIKAT